MEFYLKNVDLIDCVQDMRYEEIRIEQISHEKEDLLKQVQQINNLVTETKKKLVCYLYTKILKWIHHLKT